MHYVIKMTQQVHKISAGTFKIGQTQNYELDDFISQKFYCVNRFYIYNCQFETDFHKYQIQADFILEINFYQRQMQALPLDFAGRRYWPL
jgi:hypothetical protein